MPLPDIGQFVYISVPDGPFKGSYDSRLQEIHQDHLVFDLPTALNTHTPKVFHEGTRMVITYNDLDEKVPYSFETLVQSIRPNQMLVKSPSEILRNQRRDYVRIQVSLPVQVLYVDSAAQQIFKFSGKTEDLSGGGMSLLVDEGSPLQSGSFVGLDFPISMDGQTYPISLKAQVLRMQPSIKFPGKKRCAIKFVEIREQDRKLIMRFVFKKQIELRNRLKGK
ncbi:flagellar brake protein [Effusibacillus lacus]|uniref:Glycosyl transferase n=1 Tax=Effusibacillus lacus TaxID=1348429 RepID=A0A292YKE8_9BACL|nr:PilZ domain-containing protein [Effusibacillus lacus]TCS70824.1 c-di-GMP-binding flagellar brake protein YcgR [Effusibacillus lacus]GAX89379.1 glycosyl transferase [Effusibacillus lacus]